MNINGITITITWWDISKSKMAKIQTRIAFALQWPDINPLLLGSLSSEEIGLFWKKIKDIFPYEEKSPDRILKWPLLFKNIMLQNADLTLPEFVDSVWWDLMGYFMKQRRVWPQQKDKIQEFLKSFWIRHYYYEYVAKNILTMQNQDSKNAWELQP